MSNRAPSPDRPGSLKPRAEGDDVVLHKPPQAAMRMSADEADLSGIRMLEEAAKARETSKPEDPQ